jgi:hypothetical protein
MYLRSDKAFVSKQLGAAGHVGEQSGKVISAVIKALDAQDIILPDDNDQLEDWLEKALALFRGQVIFTEDPREWEDFVLGDEGAGRRDIVRVKPGGYTGAAGTKHNGRVGHIVGMQGRRYSIIYEDDPTNTGYLHEHTVLQKLVK